MSFIDDILLEWSWQVHNGSPDINNPTHFQILSTILTEYGTDFKYEFIHNLKNPNNLITEDETEDEKYENLSRSVYVKKGQRDKENAQRFRKDDSGRYSPITPEEAKELQSGEKDF